WRPIKALQNHVKILHGKLVGNAYAEHHAVIKEIQVLQEMDRACRAKIRTSYQPLSVGKIESK
ncbi:hypothetical protein LOAG_16129, partial [Loa loa]